MLLRALALLWRGCSEPYKTLAGVVQNAHRSMSGIQRATQKATKKRPHSFLDKGFCQERMKIRFWSTPGLVLEGFGRLPGASWVALGRSRGALGRSWPPLGRVLGVSLVLLSWAPLGCPLLSKMGSGSIFHRFWLDSGSIGGSILGGRAWFVRRLLASSRWIYMMRYFLQETHVGIHLGFSCLSCSAAVRALCAHRIGAKLAILAPKLCDGCPFGPS